MSVAAFIIPVRPAADQITIGNNRASFLFPGGRKLFQAAIGSTRLLLACAAADASVACAVSETIPSAVFSTATLLPVTVSVTNISAGITPVKT
jgi:hypothetical protein